MDNVNKVKEILKYRLSFGLGGLYASEKKYILNFYLEKNDWLLVEEQCVKQNIFQFNSLNSTKRTAKEICIRLQKLSIKEINFYLQTSIHDQCILAWIAVCRTYKFIEDFTIKVVMDAFDSYRFKISYSDFDFFYEEQIQFHQELEHIKETTRKKLRQILFRMMKEVGFLNKFNEITPIVPSPALYNISLQTKNDIFQFIPGSQ